MKAIASAFIIVIFILGITVGAILYVSYNMEYAYFEGQRDAINGKVAIELNDDGVYEWVRSPWTDKGLKYTFFHPKKKHTCVVW